MNDPDHVLDHVDSVQEGSAHLDIILPGDIAPTDPPVRFAQA